MNLAVSLFSFSPRVTTCLLLSSGMAVVIVVLLVEARNHLNQK